MDTSDIARMHEPVLRSRCSELIAPALSHPDAVFVDATCGLGGHSTAILANCPQARLIAIDRDAEALELAQRRLAAFADRTQFFHGRYDQIDEFCRQAGAGAIDAVLFDLGVSSLQIDHLDRGFSYAHDAPLDMRMDPSAPLSAADVVNTYSVADLRFLLRKYGDESAADRIARAIVRAREQEPITRSGRLVEIVSAAVPAAARRSGRNPAKRTFQALRIEVNDELGSLANALPRAIDLLALHGRIVVMSYHSGEDRLVKQVLAAATTSSAPLDLPVELEEHKPALRLLTRGAERATAAEVAANPRAASVRLRAAVRIRDVHTPHTQEMP